MKTVFADTGYWVALINPRDQWRQKVLAQSAQLGLAKIVTIDEVIIEVLNYFSKTDPVLRQAAVKVVRKIIANPNNEVIPQTHTSFLKGLQLYETRKDKQYSLTDCISMQTMREREIQEILTFDSHFQQEGFKVLA